MGFTDSMSLFKSDNNRSSGFCTLGGAHLRNTVFTSSSEEQASIHEAKSSGVGQTDLEAVYVDDWSFPCKVRYAASWACEDSFNDLCLRTCAVSALIMASSGTKTSSEPFRILSLAKRPMPLPGKTAGVTPLILIPRSSAHFV